MCSESSEQLPFDEEYLPLLLDEIFLFLIEFSFLSSTSHLFNDLDNMDGSGVDDQSSREGNHTGTGAIRGVSILLVDILDTSLSLLYAYMQGSTRE